MGKTSRRVLNFGLVRVKKRTLETEGLTEKI